jgi:hypothetical protein
MGRKKRNEIKSAFTLPDNVDEQKLIFNIAYWIAWFTKREREMIRKGYQRYLDDEKLGKLIDDPKALVWPVYDPPSARGLRFANDRST